MAVRSVNDYMSNGTWVMRVKRFFDSVDQNKNGTIEVADFAVMIDNINLQKKQARLTPLAHFMKISAEQSWTST